MGQRKVIIVEGSSDRDKIAKIITEEVEIICTNGTVSYDLLENWIEEYSQDEVIILVDADRAGENLRRELKRAFPIARNLYIDKKFKEVESTPDSNLATILVSANIAVDSRYLNGYY